MDMDIFRIAAMGICGVMIAAVVKGYKPEFATYVVIATVLVIFTMVIFKLTSVFEFLGEIYNQISYGKSFFPIILKVLAVAISLILRPKSARIPAKRPSRARLNWPGR
jgi:stage III sporulation protein AD